MKDTLRHIAISYPTTLNCMHFDCNGQNRAVTFVSECLDAAVMTAITSKIPNQQVLTLKTLVLKSRLGLEHIHQVLTSVSEFFPSIGVDHQNLTPSL